MPKNSTVDLYSLAYEAIDAAQLSSDHGATETGRSYALLSIAKSLSVLALACARERLGT